MKTFIRKNTLGTLVAILSLMSLVQPSSATVPIAEKITINLINDEGELKTGTLKLIVNEFENGTLLVRDISALDGSHYPILVHTEENGPKYVFWNQDNRNANWLCRKVGYPYGATSAVAEEVAFFQTNISAAGVVGENLKTLRLLYPNPLWKQKTSISAVTCCKFEPCQKGEE